MPVDGHARMKDLKMATTLIGDTSAARLGWLVAFTQESPARWHSATRATHGDCLLALARGGYAPSEAYDERHVTLPAPLEPSAVVGLHDELRASLRTLVSAKKGGVVEIPSEGLRETLWRVSYAGQKPAKFTTGWSADNARTGVFQALKRLVVEVGSRLLQCKGCGDAFVAVRQQVFCKESCAQRARNDRKAQRRKTENVPKNVPASSRKGPIPAHRQPTRREKLSR